MTLEETIDLLTVCAAFDRRTVGEADVTAWHAVAGDLEFADCRAAVIAHYRESRDWIMPADVRTRVKAMRRDRLERSITAAPDPELADQPGRYKAALAAAIRRIADGRSLHLAIAAPVRDDPPPQEFTEARAAFGPALPRSKQELALRQAAEARAEREERDRRSREPEVS